MAQPTDLTGMLTAGLFEPTQQAIPSSFQEAMIRQAQQAGTASMEYFNSIVYTLDAD